uniref:Uncharacterized protein n=1 Tax=Panagrolaimus sp. JU765 TaxID=591449 RepID=A0AC34RS85_9BILA
MDDSAGCNVRFTLDTSFQKNSQAFTNQRRVFKARVQVDMQLIKTIFTWLKPGQTAEKQNLAETEELDDKQIEALQLRTAVSFCDVVTAREPKVTEAASPILHTSIEREFEQNPH